MKPGARILATQEILEEFEREKSPLDKICHHYFKSRRYIGSQDRRMISNMVYDVMRKKALLGYWALQVGLEDTPRSQLLVYNRKAQLDELYIERSYHPSPLTPQERKSLKDLPETLQDHSLPDHIKYAYPEWVDSHLHQAFPENFAEELEALSKPGSFDMRVNSLKANREEMQKSLFKQGFETQSMSYSPFGFRSVKRLPLDQTTEYKNGCIEVQEEGSQLISLLVDPKPGQQVLDFCAGAGGKTLLLSALMKNKGHIIATDTHSKRLENCKKRLKRAGCENAQCKLIDSENDSFLQEKQNFFDRVLVDAPCSGSGTWRRNPDLKWRFTEDDLKELCLKQRRILAAAAPLVKPGGRLIYATCSLFFIENEQQIMDFRENHVHFNLEKAPEILQTSINKQVCRGNYMKLTPYQQGTDGFFVAVLTKKS